MITKTLIPVWDHATIAAYKTAFAITGQVPVLVLRDQNTLVVHHRPLPDQVIRLIWDMIEVEYDLYNRWEDAKDLIEKEDWNE